MSVSVDQRRNSFGVPIMYDGLPKPHLTKHEGRWVIRWHLHSKYFLWKYPVDFWDACRQLRLREKVRGGFWDEKL